jgi:hypothetical protein
MNGKMLEKSNCSFCGVSHSENNGLIVSAGVGQGRKAMDACICRECIALHLKLIAEQHPELFESMVVDARRGWTE